MFDLPSKSIFGNRPDRVKARDSEVNSFCPSNALAIIMLTNDRPKLPTLELLQVWVLRELTQSLRKIAY